MTLMKPVPAELARVEGCDCGGTVYHDLDCSLWNLPDEEWAANLQAARDRVRRYIARENRPPRDERDLRELQERKRERAEQAAIKAEEVAGMSADERVLAFLRRRVRGESRTGSLAMRPKNDDLDSVNLGKDRWPANWQHLTRCLDTRVEINRLREEYTGYCSTCIESQYRIDFNVACTCYRRVDDVVWFAPQNRIDAVFRELDWEEAP